MSYVAWTEFRCDSFMCQSKTQYEGETSAATLMAKEDGWTVDTVTYGGRRMRHHRCPRCSEQKAIEDSKHNAWKEDS